MPNPLVECIPNFSEARRPEVIQAITDTITSVPAVQLLDRHSDPDHNRTVITFVGPPDSVLEAAFQAIAKASQMIDLNQHTGEHPRIGAADVVPFVPIQDITMQQCVELAHRLGRRVADSLNIPVYFYEEAAIRPERRNLEDIRRGEYELLKTEIATNPERAPDLGPCQLGPAGAIVIGARPPLIAFNVYLTTSDVSIAKRIARAVRHSSGGLRFVKAMGVLVKGYAQVSMNLTNYHRTSIPHVVEMIRREAARYGVSIHHSELVGLIPQEALVQAAVWYLQLDEFQPSQILERRLAEVNQEATTLGLTTADYRFLDKLSCDTPTPGGGSAAAYTAAEAAALVAMVARITARKRKYASLETQMRSVINQAEALRAELSRAVQSDASAFEAILEASRLPTATAEQRNARVRAIQEATLHAAQVPLEIASNAAAVMELAVQVVSAGYSKAIPDAATAFYLARAALQGVGLNIRANIQSLNEPARGLSILTRLQQMEATALAQEKSLVEILKQRTGLPLPEHL